SHEVSVAQIALAWLLQRPAVTSVIIGAKRLDQLDDNLGAVNVAFTADEIERLDTVSALPMEYPTWMEVTQADREPGTSRDWSQFAKE
ncbi:MAG: aldo/keto reductase, partial [Acidobacteriota bacterium]|nr:aldo/keto reductase [Acidobacteriota bacterium]